jgi:hypothetical protein
VDEDAVADGGLELVWRAAVLDHLPSKEFIVSVTITALALLSALIVMLGRLGLLADDQVGKT